jgi:hypothetical protein
MKILKAFRGKENRRLIGILLAILFLLLMPAIAMLFTDEVQWTLSDFVIGGVLLLITGLGCELVLRKIKKPGYRIALCVTFLIILMLIWGEMAVGIFGTPFAGN